MSIDSSIYFVNKGLDLGKVADSYEQGLRMSDLIKKKKEDEAYKKAFSYDTGPDGKVSLNKATTLANLGKAGLGDKAFELQNQFSDQDYASQKKSFDLMNSKNQAAANLALQAKQNPQQWSQIRDTAIKNGLAQENELPMQYDDKLINGIIQKAQPAKDYLDQQFKDKELGLKLEDNKLRREEMRQLAGYRNDEKKQAFSDKLIQNFKKDMDPDSSRTGNFGTISRKLIQAEGLQTLANAFPDGNLDSRQIEELSLGLANMLSGSSGAARSQVEALVPHTWTGKMANIQEWITSNPQGAEQQEFVKRMMHTIEREKDLAAKQLNDIREKRLSAHTALRKTDPESYKSMLLSYGLSPDDYDENGLKKQTDKAVTEQSIHPENDPRVFNFMKKNNIKSIDDAVKILKENGKL